MNLEYPEIINSIGKHFPFKRILNLLFHSTLFRNSSTYVVSSFINASIPFLLMPILTRYLSTSDYGILSMITTAINFTYPILGINLEGAIQRKYFDSKHAIFNEYVGNCYLLFILNFFIITILFIFLRGYISNFMMIPSEWITYIPLIAAFQFVLMSYLIILQVQKKALRYSISQIVYSLLNFFISIILITIYKMKWDGRIIALLVSGVITVFYVLFFYKKYNLIKLTFNKKYITNSLRFGIPLIPHAIGGLLISMTGRVILTKYSGLNSTGLYTVAFQISSVISLITISFNNAYIPCLFEKLNLNDLKIKIGIVKLTYIYFLILFLIGSSTYLLLPLIFKFFIFGNFYESIRYCPWLILGFVFQGYYFMVTNYIVYVEKTYYQAIITLIVGLLNIPLTYILVLHLGEIGAAIAFCMTYFIFFILTWILSRRIYKMPWHLMKATY